MKNKSPLSDIARMLAEIRQDLVLQEHDADSEHSRQVNECESEIEEYERRIDTAQVTRDDAQGEISMLQGEIANLTSDVKNKSKQLEILDNRDLQLKSDRDSDAFNFAARTAQTTEVLGAIDLIIEKLSGIAPDSSAESVLLQLTKIGKSNPILALAQVASTFSSDSLKKVVGKVDELKESLESSLAQDNNDEEQAISDFNSLMGEISTTR